MGQSASSSLRFPHKSKNEKKGRKEAEEAQGKEILQQRRYKGSCETNLLLFFLV